MSETAMAAALKRAGAKPERSLLHVIAVEKIRANPNRMQRAIYEFVNELRDSGSLLVELMGEALSVEAVEKRAAPFMYQVAADMRGESSGVKPGDGVRVASESRCSVGLISIDPAQAGGSVRDFHEDLPEIGTPETSEMERSGENVDSLSAPGLSVSPQDRDGGVRSQNDTLSQVSPAAPIRNKPRDARALHLMHERTPQLFKTFLVRGDRPIGGITFGELRTLAATSEYEAALFRLIDRHAQAQPPSLTVEEVISEATLRELMEKAKHFRDALVRKAEELANG